MTDFYTMDRRDFEQVTLENVEEHTEGQRAEIMEELDRGVRLAREYNEIGRKFKCAADIVRSMGYEYKLASIAPWFVERLNDIVFAEIHAMGITINLDTHIIEAKEPR